jgi:hypothetical protein
MNIALQPLVLVAISKKALTGTQNQWKQDFRLVFAVAPMDFMELEMCAPGPVVMKEENLFLVRVDLIHSLYSETVFLFGFLQH